MGKNKGAHKNANVFKVPTARSNKLKAKAKKMVCNLKKLDSTSKGSKDTNKDKTMSINQLMDELHKDIASRSNKKKPDAKTQKKPVSKNKAPLVRRMPPAQMAAAASMVEKMEL
ncbi:hypothetical protein X777_02980 [Ooceraea biroi]|uniref:Uncharacterized protein n=1 Tax=Ooceraea biroi TaxID=2015173 RepID=A0A026WL12_OOCBI|nr:hypothetical protein X777_02980 [Ooceraea biroi]